MPVAGDIAESQRLAEDHARVRDWKRWGPYLAERQWGTVREDYSPDGSCWTYFPHEHARSRAYRWGEDGLLGICDRECRLCFALALWNGRDPILKERLFGLTGPEGNHGEDVKECYFYLDATPTHSYLKALYKYPQAEFPYARLVEENRRRGKAEPEFELAGHRRLRREPLLRRRRGVRQGRRPTTSSFASRSPTAAPRPRRCTCCRRCGSATPGPGAAQDEGCWGEAANLAADGDGVRVEHATLGECRSGTPAPSRQGARRASVHRKRDQRRAALRRPQREPVRQGRVSRLRRRTAAARR